VRIKVMLPADYLLFGGWVRPEFLFINVPEMAVFQEEITRIFHAFRNDRLLTY